VGGEEALRVIWGVLVGSEGSPKGRKKCTKPYRKALRTVQKAAQRPEEALEKPSGSFVGFWGVRRAVLKAVKSLQSPTEKRCERRGRQRKGRKKKLDSHANVGKAEQEPGLILSSRRNAARMGGEKPCGSFGGSGGFGGQS
jgi:hypothetical protein